MSNLEMKEGGQNYTLMLLVSGAALIVSGSTSIGYSFGMALDACLSVWVIWDLVQEYLASKLTEAALGSID